MQKAIIYGAGTNGKNAYEVLRSSYDIIFFCDKDKAKWGTEYKGKKYVRRRF